MTTALEGASEKRRMTEYVTDTVLDCQFRGTFVLSFNEQFRRLDDLTNFSERTPESIKMAILINAAKDIPQLSIFETLDEYTSATSGHGSCTHLSYSPYYDLLINACVKYDPKTLQPPQRNKISIQLLEHKITSTSMSPTKHSSPKALIHL